MELNEEEKKALEIFKEIKDVRGIRQDVEGENEDLWALDIVSNLIEKQQKEIERIKSLDIYKLIEEWETGQLIHKDKIKEKIEKLESLSKNITMQPSIYNYEIDLLKELLEEN